MQYYFITDLKIVGKMDDYVPYIYSPGIGWMPDNENILMDRLMGYDEERIGSSDMLDRIEEITEEKAIKLIGQ